MLTAVPERTLRRAVESAVRAPSIFNSQPWRWRTGSTTGLDLFADPCRHLGAVDLDRRDLILSCGAALHHLIVALGALGFAGQIDRLPDPQNLDHLAHIQPREATPSLQIKRLAQAIGRRSTDRRRFSAEPVPQSVLRVLTDHAEAQGGALNIASGTTARARVIELLAMSAGLQCKQPGYTAQLMRWASRYAQSGDGIQAGSVPTGIGNPGEVPMRWFPHAALAQSPRSFEHEDASALMILSSPSDDRLDVLRAGEATSAVLLAATELGLSTTLLSQPTEVAQTRSALSRLVASNLCPQLVLRVGWPQPGAAELPPTPRRRHDHVTRSSQ
jgi:nitroreductase